MFLLLPYFKEIRSGVMIKCRQQDILKISFGRKTCYVSNAFNKSRKTHVLDWVLIEQAIGEKICVQFRMKHVYLKCIIYSLSSTSTELGTDAKSIKPVELFTWYFILFHMVFFAGLLWEKWIIKRSGFLNFRIYLTLGEIINQVLFP